MASMVVARPSQSEYAPFYGGYVAAVPDGDFLALLERQGRETMAALGTVTEERAGFRYAPGKWSIREVMGHLTDAERVFTYRALHFARGAGTPLPSFDENAWAEVAGAERRTLSEHLAEFAAVRAATIALFHGFSEVEFGRSGTASGNPVSVRALAYITAGHERHHLTVLREKYRV
ncbi:MAG: DinB family protein [Gemmatimonadaceae bacterium]